MVIYGGKVSDRLELCGYEILQYLVRHFGKFCTLEALADFKYGLILDRPDNPRHAIASAIKRMRPKIEAIGLTITSIAGTGNGWKLERVSASNLTRTEPTLEQSAY